LLLAVLKVLIPQLGCLLIMYVETKEINH